MNEGHKCYYDKGIFFLIKMKFLEKGFLEIGLYWKCTKKYREYYSITLNDITKMQKIYLLNLTEHLCHIFALKKSVYIKGLNFQLQKL